MEEWYNDSLPAYPRVLIRKEQAPFVQHLSRPRGDGNSVSSVVRIRVQGRKSSSDSDQPKVTVHRYYNSSSPNSPQVTVEAVRAGTAIPIQIKHLTSAPVTSIACAQPHKGYGKRPEPMKALPLTSVGYDINSNPLDLQCQRSTDYSVSTNSRSPQRFRSPLADDVFDSFQKQFDKFSSEYTSVTSKHGYSRSQTHHIEESKHRVYSSRRHESEKISESRYRHSSGSSHLERTQEQRGRAPSPNVYLSSYFTRRESPARRTSSEDRLVRNTSDSVTEETLKQEVNSPRVRARLVLDKVLKDLVNKEGCRHQRGKSITKDASDTNKTCGNELNSCKGFQDDADSGYSGSGDTRAGFTCPTTDIKEQVRKYNENHQNNRFTKVSRGNTEETFHGDIQICMCLDHPVSMLLNTRPVSIFQSTQQNLGEDEKITASATIPQNTITKLRITSEDTSSVVIRHLLNKFNIIDSPKSYGLYEQTSDESDKEVKLRKISSTEKPLLIFLQWNSKPKEKKKFLLKECYSGDIMMEYKQEMELLATKFHTHRHNILSKMRELRPNEVLYV